jgi:hypothetical protein
MIRGMMHDRTERRTELDAHLRSVQARTAEYQRTKSLPTLLGPKCGFLCANNGFIFNHIVCRQDANRHACEQQWRKRQRRGLLGRLFSFLRQYFSFF